MSSEPSSVVEPLWLDVRAAQTAFRRRGTGETALYLHGEALARRWLPFHEALAAELDLIAPETPGFGDTERPAWFETMSDAVLHYDEFCERLGLGPVHLMGHSLGAWIAAELAVQYPRRIRTLTLIAPIGLRVTGHPIADFFRMTDAELPDAFVNGDQDVYEHFLEEGDPVETRVRTYTEMTAAAYLMWNPRYDAKLDERLDRITSPALIVVPEDDRIVPREHFERWAQLLPSAQLQTVPGTNTPTGHYLVVQEPDSVARAILDFIGAAQ